MAWNISQPAEDITTNRAPYFSCDYTVIMMYEEQEIAMVFVNMGSETSNELKI